MVAPLLLNSLPTDIRLIDNVSKFNSKLKTYLLKQVYELSYDFIFYHFFFVCLCFCYNVKIIRKLVYDFIFYTHFYSIIKHFPNILLLL